ncbi:hypothetical protein [Brachybacterium sp. ACRRE]|uniref:SWIM zinc finger family protein n=1 Tax=Brachybacterium sp. ACRRE TaxID=2918184 RepID=UPI001EF1C26C|nr:hypothetical protein [Brachybacterium sp. ACRRE]MCG7309371.1 hypothetical protein [Brachybacterium sp. ACRRE]
MSIRMRSRRGQIGASWQGAALRESLESVISSGRRSSGRRLARADRVQWLDVAPRRARAGVLDDDGTIYEPELDVSAFGAADRQIVVDTLRAHPELPALLSSGTYPQAVESELDAHMATLLPGSASEVTHDCTCLDWPGPCVHVAALACVLVEAIDEAPVHLLTLRGLTLSEIAQPIATGRGARALAEAAGPSDGEPPQGASAAGRSSDEVETDGAATGGEASGGISSAGSPSADGAADASADEETAGDETTGGRSAIFDPAIADPTLLQDALGEEASAMLASFYASGAGSAGSAADEAAGED